MSRILFSLQVDALTPLLVGGERAAGNQVWTLDYIPGAQIRGALAMKLARKPLSSADLTTLFGRGGITVHNAYPVSEHGGAPFFPLPLSTRQSKYESPGAEYVDTLLVPRWWAEPLKHPSDQAPLERPRQVFGPILSGIQLYPPDHNRQTIRPARCVSTHLEIDRTTGTHREGVLFTLETLAEDSKFDGLLVCTEEQAKLLACHLGLSETPVTDAFGRQTGTRYSGSIELSVGQARSRGFGRIKVTLDQTEAPDPSTVFERLAAFNGTIGVSSGPLWFSLTLVSDAILVDERLRFRPALDVPDLEWECPDLKGLVDRLEKVAAVQRLISAWHGGAGLPRPDDLGIAMGSAFLYVCKPETQEKLATALGKLEMEGVGCRRADGFGRLVACAPWHTVGYESLRSIIEKASDGGRTHAG